jgi:hypothetical protein
LFVLAGQRTDGEACLGRDSVAHFDRERQEIILGRAAFVAESECSERIGAT